MSGCPETLHVAYSRDDGPVHEYIRSDLIDQGIKDALKERWTGVRNKIVDKLQDQITDDQLQVVLQIIDDEQWFPRFEKAIRNGEAEEVEK